MRRFVLLCLLFALVPSVGGIGRAAVTKGPIQYVTVDDGTKIAVSVYYPDRFDKTKRYPALITIEGYGGAGDPDDTTFVGDPGPQDPGVLIVLNCDLSDSMTDYDLERGFTVLI